MYKKKSFVTISGFLEAKKVMRMQLVDELSRLMSRFRHPNSLPEDIANDLGITLSNHYSCEKLLELLASPQCKPTKLYWMMSRHEAEASFRFFLKKEQFKSSTLFSYYFNKGWVIFSLYYDHLQRLRRVHLQYPCGTDAQDHDLFLPKRLLLPEASSQ